jgi:hypothetical protein
MVVHPLLCDGELDTRIPIIISLDRVVIGSKCDNLRLLWRY